MKIFFLLSGEHETLPKAEALAVLESDGIRFRAVAAMNQVLIVDCDRIPQDSRLAMSHAICEFLGECGASREEILQMAEKLKLELRGSFVVRVRRIKEHAQEIKTDKLESEIGRRIAGSVNLKNPEETILGVLAEKFVLGRVLSDIDKAQYAKRVPKERPYFKPGVMLPKNARAVVNLSRVRAGEKFMDPFCGTGGLLIEASLIGAEAYGCDVDEDVIGGCEKNLKSLGIKNYHLAIADARKLNEKYKNFFDAVATDPPYGISTSTMGVTLEQLYSDTMKTLHDILKPGRYACIMAPQKVDIEQYAEYSGFKVVERHFERMHKSLVRKIVVIKKNDRILKTERAYTRFE